MAVRGLGLRRWYSDTVAPTVAEDLAAGYRLGDHWVDTVTDTAYVLVDASSGTWTALGGSGSGTMNHALLTSNLAWATSGHTGTASRLAGFSGAGAATTYQIGVDVQAYGADLTAIEALVSGGIAARTAADTWALRTITGTASEVSVTNGAGAAGDPTIGLASNPVIPGVGGMVVPVGVTGTRGASTTGRTRYNTTLTALEVYDGAAWDQLATWTRPLSGFGAPTASVQFAQQQALQFAIENRTSDPGSPVAGQIWLRTDL